MTTLTTLEKMGILDEIREFSIRFELDLTPRQEELLQQNIVANIQAQANHHKKYKGKKKCQ